MIAALAYLLAYPCEPIPCSDDGAIVSEPGPSPVPLVYRRPRPVRIAVTGPADPWHRGRSTLGIVPAPGRERRRAVVDRLARQWGHR